MIFSDNLLRFDLFQQLVEWLNVSMHDYRKGRHFLEINISLAESETDKEMERLINAQVEDTLESFPVEHATTLVSLGNAHRRRAD